MAYFKRDMLSIHSRNLLGRYLTEAIISARAIEPFKGRLADIPYFDCVGLFRYLDHNEKGYLVYSDFARIMGNIDERYLRYGFSRLDTLKVGQVSKIQFANFLIPQRNSQLKELVAQRMSQPDIGQVPETIAEQVQVFSSLLQKIIVDQVQVLAPLRRQLLKADDYSLVAVLNALDTDRHEFVVGPDIFKFLKGVGGDIEQSHVETLISMYDSDLNGKLALTELHWAIEGFQGQNKPKYVQNLLKSTPKKPKNKHKPQKNLPLKQIEAKKFINENPPVTNGAHNKEKLAALKDKIKGYEMIAQQIDSQLRLLDLNCTENNELQKQEIISDWENRRLQEAQQQVRHREIEKSWQEELKCKEELERIVEHEKQQNARRRMKFYEQQLHQLRSYNDESTIMGTNKIKRKHQGFIYEVPSQYKSLHHKLPSFSPQSQHQITFKNNQPSLENPTEIDFHLARSREIREQIRMERVKARHNIAIQSYPQDYEYRSPLKREEVNLPSTGKHLFT